MNAAIAVELQQCRGELQNTRTLADESRRAAQGSAALLERVSLRRPESSVQESVATTMFKISFAYGSSRPILTDEASKALIATARSALLVLVHDRTGAPNATLANRLWQRRVAAVRNYLTQAGFDPGLIRVTYEPTGERAADQPRLSVQTASRQVAVEVYRALPAVHDAMACAQN